MKIVVGLGNPGAAYRSTRHNAGRMAVDFLREHFLCSAWSLKQSLRSYIATGMIDGERIILVKPNVYMNVSGEAVGATMAWYKASPEDLVVIHDDTDLPVGTFKIQSGRGAAGHNGVASVVAALHTKQFTRVRLGVRPVGNTLPAMDIVLARMSTDERGLLYETFDDVAAYLRDVVS